MRWSWAQFGHNPDQAYWITSSARDSSDGGIVRPSALAVLRLMTSSNFVGCSTGRSAGFAPLRILSPRRKWNECQKSLCRMPKPEATYNMRSRGSERFFPTPPAEAAGPTERPDIKAGKPDRA
jgi:hypothetical protein